MDISYHIASISKLVNGKIVDKFVTVSDFLPNHKSLKYLII